MALRKTPRTPVKGGTYHEDVRTANRTVVIRLFGASEAVQEGLDGTHLQSWFAILGHLSLGAWFRDVQDFLTAWPLPGTLGQPDSVGDYWKSYGR